MEKRKSGREVLPGTWWQGTTQNCVIQSSTSIEKHFQIAHKVDVLAQSITATIVEYFYPTKYAAANPEARRGKSSQSSKLS